MVSSLGTWFSLPRLPVSGTFENTRVQHVRGSFLFLPPFLPLHFFFPFWHVWNALTKSAMPKSKQPLPLFFPQLASEVEQAIEHHSLTQYDAHQYLETVPYLFGNSLDPFSYASGATNSNGEQESKFKRGNSNRHLTELRVSVINVAATRSMTGSIGLGLEEKDGIPSLYVVDPTNVGQEKASVTEASIDGSVETAIENGDNQYLYMGQVPEGAALLRINGLDVTRCTVEDVVHMLQGNINIKACAYMCAHVRKRMGGA